MADGSKCEGDSRLRQGIMFQELTAKNLFPSYR